ncbi:conserved Plasmodium protein, unknown function [Plasmodium vivax]|uniref:KELT protein n=1 Tax=Plasmodium vivax TaxID=5855 RepID=A0A1G4HI91_PLAVI|nr:conserved Plasmodium protein, unknown function [Plasmodium vivax]
MSFKMKYFYKLAIVLVYIHTYFMRNRCVRKVFLAEKEPDSGVKSGDGKGSYDDDDDTMTEVIRLLSLQALGQEQEEQKKSEEEGAAGGAEEKGAAGGEEEMGAVGGEEEMETGETSPRKRRLSLRQTHFQLKDIKKYKGSSEEEQTEKVQEKGATSSVSSSKVAPEEKPEKTNDPELDEFRRVLKECDDMNVEIGEEAIEEYIEVGVNTVEKISQVHKDYPLNLAKGIDFENPRMPFGVADKNFDLKSENELRDTLYFDDYMNIPLFEFLNNTMVGNLSLAKVNHLYVKESMKYQACSGSLLEYLGSKNLSFNIDHYFGLNLGTYLSEEQCEICNFEDPKIRAIRERHVENTYVVERLTVINCFRHLNFAERRKLRDIIFYQHKNISHIKKTLSLLAEKRFKIKKDSMLLSQNFSLPKNFIYKDVILLTCLHYVTSYSIVILKPLKIKVVGKGVIQYREFYNTSGMLNHLIALLEFMENNSQLCRKFFDTYKNVGGFYPRLKSTDDIVPIFNYLTVRYQICCIMYNIGKLISKFQYCEDRVTNYEEHLLGDYVKTIFSLERTLNKAKELLKH